MEKVEKQKIARYIVDNTAHSFLDKESIIENFIFWIWIYA